MPKLIAFGVGLLLGLIVLTMLIAWPFLAMWNYAVVQAVTIAQPLEYWPAFWLMLFVGLFFVGSRSSSRR